MRNYRILVFISVIFTFLAGCTPAEESSPTPDIDAIVAATVSAQEQAFYQPTLLSPVDGVSFANPASVVLDWEWVRELGEGEFYDVRVWREGEPDYGITWASDDEFALAEWLSQREPGQFFWSVAVIKGDPDSGTVEAVLGNAPAARRFTVESNQLPAPTPEPTAEPITIDTLVTSLPAGFEAEIYAHITEAPTSIADIEFDVDGSLLALAIDGRIYRLRDSDGDGAVDEYMQVLSRDLSFEWAIGFAIYDDRIYISDQERVGYVEDSDDDGIFDVYTNIVDELPGRAYPLHSNNGILIYDDLIYLAVGSTTDHGPINHEYEAAILTMNLDGSELQVFAHGFRNPYDIDMSPDGRLFTTDNSPDALNAGLMFIPPEELNYVREGYHYGFPYVYGNGYAIRDVDYETENPVTQFVASTVSVGLAYYAGNQFPETYQDGVFVGQFGGLNPARRIVFVPLEETEDGNYRGDWQPFIQLAEGFQPTSLDTDDDGSLYFVEWTNGYIIRVSYAGE